MAMMEVAVPKAARDGDDGSRGAKGSARGGGGGGSREADVQSGPATSCSCDELLPPCRSA